MTLGEVKDIVREHFGRVGWPTFMLDQALAAARREIEKAGNFYWMRTSGTVNTIASTQTYLITTTLTNFKDLRSLHAKETTETLWTEVPIGYVSLEEAFLAYPTDEENFPQLGVVDNATLYLFPTPDAIYNLKFWAWQWTSAPTAGNTGSDELTSRWPDALIYGALVWGAEQYQKNYPDADRWRALLAAEIAKIHNHNFEREHQDRLTLMPSTGPFTQRRRTFPNHGCSIWI